MHNIWLIDTRSVQVRQTLIFKYEYLIDPFLTESGALLQSSAEFSEALQGLSSNIKGETESAIEMLIVIFKTVANDVVSMTDNQWVTMTKAPEIKEATEDSDPPHNLVPQEYIDNNQL